MYGAGWTHYTGEVRFNFFTNTSKIIFSPFYIFNPHHQGRKGQDVWSNLVPAPIQPQVSKWAPKSWKYFPNPFSLLFSLSRSPNAAALQGTSCGQGRHCKGGLCVPKTLPQEGVGDSAVSGETFWESFSPVTSTAATSTVATSPSTSEPGRVVYFPKTLDICQFFAQFGITLNICQRWHIN